jgi:TolB-like protein/Flp pilus assembly protein TadD
VSEKPSFLSELKRRNVYKVAVAYAIVAWLLIQAASILFPTYEAPAWVMKVFIAVIVLGFPVALVLAWAFEITPEGIVRAEDVSPNQSITHKTGRKLIGVTIVLAVIAAGLVAFQIRRHATETRMQGGARVEDSAGRATPDSVSQAGLVGARPSIPEKSIAVLPFENLSDDKANAYFTEGIQDEILTRLSKIGALKVISRTSTQKYKSAPDNLREIGQQLGVANILEGSVQKAGSAVHVNVQLIRAVTDDHLWAESYNRTLEDIFGVEGEIAQTVAEALKAKLTGAEEKALTEKPTNNPAAYEAYLRGTAQGWQLVDGTDKAAQKSFEEAVRLDPQFAGAWAALSRTHSKLFFHTDQTPEERASAEKALAEATRLRPDLPETQLAGAYFQYWVLRDYKGALEMMRKLHISWPNNSEIPQAMSFISARLGQWPEALADIEQAVALNPHETFTRIQAMSTALAMREFDKVLEMSDNALQIWPNDLNFLGFKTLAFQARGQLDQAQTLLDKVPPNSSALNVAGGASFYQAWLRQDPAPALKWLATLGEAGKTDPQSLIYFGFLHEMAGQKMEAQANLIQARDKLVELLNKQPDNPEFLGPLAFAFAWLGQREEALQTIGRYDSATVGDARSIGIGYELKARIFARLGNKDDAIASLERLLASPSDSILGPPLTPALLRIDPNFTSLRGDPRFENLCQESTK